MYDLSVKTRVTQWNVKHVASEATVQRYIGEVLASEGLPRPGSLTDAAFAARLAQTGAYDETVQDGAITVRRSRTSAALPGQHQQRSMSSGT